MQPSLDEDRPAAPRTRLLAIEGVLDRLPIGRTKLYELLGKGELESCSLGARRFVPEDALDAYIERLRSPGAPDAPDAA